MSRVRDNSSVVSQSYSTVQTVLPSGPTYGPSVGTSTVNSVDVMVDVVTPGFQAKQRQGEIVISPMTKHVVKRTLLDGYASVVTPQVDWRLTGAFVYDGSASTWTAVSRADVEDEVARLRGLAITDAYAGVGKPDVAVLTELAELRETLAFLYSPVKKMVTLTKRFSAHKKKVEARQASYAKRKAKWDKLPPRLRKSRVPPEVPKDLVFSVGRIKATDLSSAWLAYRYGLMPLIYSFQDVQSLLKKRAAGNPIRATARAKATSEIDVSDAGTFTTETWQGGTYKYKYPHDGVVKISVRAGVMYEVDWSILTQLGIQWNRVPMAMYEAVPLSFVSDWFHNGAAAYDALTAEFRANKMLGAWTVASVEADVQWHVNYEPVSNCSASASGTYFLTSEKWKQRKLASVTDVKLGLRVQLNGKRIADGLALIHTFLATAMKKQK